MKIELTNRRNIYIYSLTSKNKLIIHRKYIKNCVILKHPKLSLRWFLRNYFIKKRKLKKEFKILLKELPNNKELNEIVTSDYEEDNIIDLKNLLDVIIEEFFDNFFEINEIQLINQYFEQ